MSTLYGDNIFESTDAFLDRLIESIETDLMLFESVDILNEMKVKTSAKIKYAIGHVIEKIKKLLKAIKNKFDEIIGKITGTFMYKKTVKDIKTRKLPIQLLYPNVPELNKYQNAIHDYYKLIVKYNHTVFADNLDSNKEEMEKSKAIIDKDFFKTYDFDGKEHTALDIDKFFLVIDIDSEEERKKVDTYANKIKTTYVTASQSIRKFNTLINEISKSVDKMSKETNKREDRISSENDDKNNKALQLSVDRDRLAISGYMQLIKYMKAYIGSISACLKEAVYNGESED